MLQSTSLVARSAPLGIARCGGFGDLRLVSTKPSVSVSVRFASSRGRTASVRSNGQGRVSWSKLGLAGVLIGLGAAVFSADDDSVKALRRMAIAPSLIARTGETQGDTDDPFDWKRKACPELDLIAANAKLRAGQLSYLADSRDPTGVTRFDILRLESNSPTEDEFAFGTVNVGQRKDWAFWGVYDGHAGWATSAVLRRALIPYVGRQIRDAAEKVRELSPGAVDAAITAAFLRLDDEIISDGLRALTDAQTESEAVSRTAPARAGSCALLAVLDPRNSLLRVACVGDSRAVLGRQSSPGTDRITIPLSKDQTGFDEGEVARLATEHPRDTDIIDPKSGRLLGIAVTRAFGDHRWKWPTTAIQQWSETHFGSGPRPNYKSPPYMSAEPVITTTKIESGDFVILASDGLWDRISSEDAVRCVSMWLERRPSKGSAAIPEAHNAELGFPKSKVTPDTFVVDDDNVATHLTRNALGGKRRDLFCAEMSLQAPDSRHERDDITVQVIFFGPLDRDAKAKL